MRGSGVERFPCDSGKQEVIISTWNRCVPMRIVGSPPKHFGDWCSHTWVRQNSSPTRWHLRAGICLSCQPTAQEWIIISVIMRSSGVERFPWDSGQQEVTISPWNRCVFMIIVGSPPKHFGDWCFHTSVRQNLSPTRQYRVGEFWTTSVRTPVSKMFRWRTYNSHGHTSVPSGDYDFLSWRTELSPTTLL